MSHFKSPLLYLYIFAPKPQLGVILVHIYVHGYKNVYVLCVYIFLFLAVAPPIHFPPVGAAAMPPDSTIEYGIQKKDVGNHLRVPCNFVEPRRFCSALRVWSRLQCVRTPSLPRVPSMGFRYCGQACGAGGPWRAGEEEDSGCVCFLAEKDYRS